MYLYGETEIITKLEWYSILHLFLLVNSFVSSWNDFDDSNATDNESKDKSFLS